MSEELSIIFHKIEQELLVLHWMWEQYYNLFCIDDGRIDILNKVAGQYFYITQRGLQENLVLGITKIASLEKTGKYENLTIKQIPNLVDDLSIRNELKMQLEWNICLTSQFAFEWRNKYHAHFDLDYLTDKVRLTEKLTINNFELCLGSFRNFMNTISSHYKGSITDYLHPQTGSALNLIQALNDALNFYDFRYSCQEGEINLPAIFLKQRLDG